MLSNCDSGSFANLPSKTLSIANRISIGNFRYSRSATELRVMRAISRMFLACARLEREKLLLAVALDEPRERA